LKNTVKLVQACEQLGFHRFWFAEQHAMGGFAGFSPEVMIASVASQTSKIRLGSGSILLNHYSPYKVAEIVSVLSSLHGPRIDIGIGRDLGPDQDCITEMAFPNPVHAKNEYYEQKLVKLLRAFDSQSRPMEYAMVDHTVPTIDFWISGTKKTSALLAAKHGLPYIHGIFPGTSHKNPGIIHAYQSEFVPSAYLDKPYAMLALNIVCADNQAEAKKIALSDAMLHVDLQNNPGDRSFKYKNPESFDLESISDVSRETFEKRMANMILGSPQECKDQVDALVQSYNVDEVMLVSNCYDNTLRKASFEKLATIYALES
jgi:luciferase family oxidoreductase group 1